MEHSIRHIFLLCAAALATTLPACGPTVVETEQDSGSSTSSSGGGEADQGSDDSGCSPPADACGATELHVVGLYDSYDAASGQENAAHVHVDRPGLVKLFLSAYSATAWSVTTGPDTDLLEVVAHGYHTQSVSAPAGVPASAVSYETDGIFLGCGYEWPDMDPTSGCETDQLVPAIETFMGQPVSSFHGCYAMSDVTIAADLSSASNCATGGGYDHTSAVFCTADPGGDDDHALGEYRGYFCPEGPFIITNDILQADALANCQLNADTNPTMSVLCTWNGEVIFVNEVTPGACDGLPNG